MNQDIQKFFDNVKVVLSDNSVKDTTITAADNNQELDYRTNVIYLTTRCNLDCDYCYEYEKRHNPDFVHKDCTLDEIDAFIKDIEQRESGVNSTIVLMGGEPFLRMDLIEYTLNRAIESNKPGGYGLNIITNGVLLNKPGVVDKLKSWIDMMKKSQSCGFVFEVSYDGSGHVRRCFPDHQTSEPYVERALHLLDDAGIDYKLSYTCHSKNYETIIPDIIRIIHKFKNCYAINIGFAYYDLDTVLGPGGSIKFRDEFIPKAEVLFKKFNIPLCGTTCHICKKCNTSAQTGNAYLSPENGVLYLEKSREVKFDQF